jgi:hypothetical protein
MSRVCLVAFHAKAETVAIARAKADHLKSQDIYVEIKNHRLLMPAQLIANNRDADTSAAEDRQMPESGDSMLGPLFCSFLGVALVFLKIIAF